MVENLIANQTILTSDRSGLFKIGHIEVTHTPAQYLARVLKFLESCDCVVQRVAAAPVQKVAIQPVGLKAAERPLARRDCSRSRSILRQDLGDQEDLIAAPADGLGNYLLGSAGSVHLGGVDMVHA